MTQAHTRISSFFCTFFGASLGRVPSLFSVLIGAKPEAIRRRSPSGSAKGNPDLLAVVSKLRLPSAGPDCWVAWVISFRVPGFAQPPDAAGQGTVSLRAAAGPGHGQRGRGRASGRRGSCHRAAANRGNRDTRGHRARHRGDLRRAASGGQAGAQDQDAARPSEGLGRDRPDEPFPPRGRTPGPGGGLPGGAYRPALSRRDRGFFQGLRRSGRCRVKADRGVAVAERPDRFAAGLGGFARTGRRLHRPWAVREDRTPVRNGGREGHDAGRGRDVPVHQLSFRLGDHGSRRDSSDFRYGTIQRRGPGPQDRGSR